MNTNPTSIVAMSYLRSSVFIRGKNLSCRFTEDPLGSRPLVRPGSGADRWFEIKSQVHPSC